MHRTRFGRIAVVEQGTGPAALFIHGYPLNGYQWRGALERLASVRRCVAPDLMGLGYSEVSPGQALSPEAQVGMLVDLMEVLSIHRADLIGNDSGLAIAQLLATRHPGRVRSLLLTNGDVHENSPPALLQPFIEQARAGRAADDWLLPQFLDKARARAPGGLGAIAYTDPGSLTDESIEYYFGPLVRDQARKSQFEQYAVAFQPNPLVAIEELLRRSTIPARIVWGTRDPLFPVEGARWLDRTLPRSQGIRWVEGANLFFPEERPDLIADEARALWGDGP